MTTLISNSGTWKIYLEYYVLKYIGRKFRLWLVERKWLWKIEQDGYVVLYKWSVKPTDAEGSVGCKRPLLHLHFHQS